MSIETYVKQAALDLGFDLVGIARMQDPFFKVAVENYKAWIQKDYGACMNYLKKHIPLKEDPSLFLPECKSVICVGLLYADAIDSSSSIKTDVKISQYTRGEDYHAVLHEKLHCLEKTLQKTYECNTRSFVDSEPVLERFWAWRAGLGWLGKNTCLIHRKLGSFLFLGGIFTNLELAPDTPELNHCGKCRKCIEACPTQAIIEPQSKDQPHWVDSNKCIAYHTIENRSLIPEELMQKSGGWLAGCDICQSVCPWNNPVTTGKSFQNSNPVMGLQLSDLAKWSESDFKIKMKNVAMKRMKYSGFLKNLIIAVAHSHLPLEEKAKIFNEISKNIYGLKNGQEGALHALRWARYHSLQRL